MRDTKIADELIANILQISYQGLSSKLKKVEDHYIIMTSLNKILHNDDVIIQDVGLLHQRFFDECFTRLNNLGLVAEREEPVPVATTGKTPGTKQMDM